MQDLKKRRDDPLSRKPGRVFGPIHLGNAAGEEKDRAVGGAS